MNAAQRHALRIASDLEQLNLARGHLGARYVDPMTAGGAWHLMRLAMIDRQRRELRRQLHWALLAGAPVD